MRMSLHCHDRAADGARALVPGGGFLPIPHFLEPVFPHMEHAEHGILGTSRPQPDS